MREHKIDKIFLLTTAIMVLGGLFIFTSASLGLLARDGASFSSVAFNQIFLGVFLGSLALILFSKINYKVWNKYAFYIFLGSLILTALVFIPDVGIKHGGATRWLSLGPFSFQPAELLKIGFVIYFSAWLAGVKTKILSLKYGIIPFCIMIGIIAGILLGQPDTGTLIVIVITGMGMFLVSGGKWKHILGLIVVISIGFIILTSFEQYSYLKDRVLTYFDPGRDPTGSGYQIQQSLIAIGSGGMFGRGFGQSIQKFSSLPEPIGDSIFAVFAEEWGFVGSIVLFILFLVFTFRGFKIASRAPTNFGRLLVVGIILLIITQSSINIASMLGVSPITGMPLIFVSKGGTALFFALASVGIVLNVSKYRKAV
ncbi:putative lipid II flippase FtsW [Patescibacteria group bacterium]|nr:putative lipid II flippase FtsW [Patescibacteria group bacterium]MBU4057380.1 putative lipid II flippase FtsW [Patescibacteria group bacterium]MBU4116007.1 putative lipid II flippase FtsW [Patescibacteria group bacterium]